MYHKCNIAESLEFGDLRNLVSPSLHLDEYKSKMGDDEDICVLSFKVSGSAPAQDLADFIEKGYEWVLDADVSSGELEDGEFLVFIEAEREPSLAGNIFKMMQDIMNLTKQSIKAWTIVYPKLDKKKELSLQSLQKIIPKNRKEYEIKVGKEPIDKLKVDAGLPINTKAPDNELTEALRIAAGIR